MTSDISHAFAHPELRAAATAPAPRDRISLRDHVLTAEIGAFQQERGTPQRLRFNVVVEVRPGAAVQDDVDRILSYDRVTDAIAAELAAERLNLLETLAERIAARILLEPQALRVFVRVEKLDRGPYALGVEIERSRADLAPRPDPADTPVRPLLVHLSNAAIAARDLPARLDALQAEAAAVVLTVGLPDAPRPLSPARAAQRRIDLLAIEQNAWVLAGRDRRCVVVQSRTEIDWALRQGGMLVWAPSKLVLDAVNGPGSGQGPVALTLWLADQLGADRVLLLGAAQAHETAGSRVPVETRPL